MRLAPLFIVSLLIPRSNLFSLSLFFSFLFFSSFLCSFDVRKREHRGLPNTMRRNWKSPDAENWSFPMIREFIELDSRILRISIPFLANYNFKSESVTITLPIVFVDSYLWEKSFKEIENLSRWNGVRRKHCDCHETRFPRGEENLCINEVQIREKGKCICKETTRVPCFLIVKKTQCCVHLNR